MLNGLRLRSALVKLKDFPPIRGGIISRSEGSKIIEIVSCPGPYLGVTCLVEHLLDIDQLRIGSFAEAVVPEGIEVLQHLFVIGAGVLGVFDHLI